MRLRGLLIRVMIVTPRRVHGCSSRLALPAATQTEIGCVPTGLGDSVDAASGAPGG